MSAPKINKPWCTIELFQKNTILLQMIWGTRYTPTPQIGTK